MKRVDKYVNPERVLELTQAHELASARSLLEAVQNRREELRKPVETGKLPLEPEKMEDHFLFRLGEIKMATWILELPNQAREYLKNLPEGDKA